MKWLRFPRILGIVVCLYLIGMSLVFGMLSSQNYRFVRDAAKATGTVVALVPRSPIGSARDPDARTVSRAPTVRYEVAGKTYEYTAAHGRFRQTLKIGDHITVLYDPADPAVARMRGEGKVLVPVITSGFVLSALVVALMLFRTRNLGASPSQSKPAERSDGVREPQDHLG